MGGREANDNCGIGVDAGVEDEADRWIVPQLVALLPQTGGQPRLGQVGPRGAPNCPDGLWTNAQHAVAQLPGTRRHRLSTGDGSQV